MKKIGLVGGLGWVSTLEYYKLINVLTNQKLGGHKSAHVLIESLDEGLFLENQSKDPTEKMCEKMIVDAVEVLVSGGAEVVALCANGLHRFMPAIKAKYDVKFVDIRDATAKSIQKVGLDRVGLIGVQKTMETEFYKGVLKNLSIEAVVPDLGSRKYIHQKIVSELVLNEFSAETKHGFLSVIEELVEQNVQGVILGCTEIPLLLTASKHKGIPLFSTTEIHCREIVERALN
ncbi:aspartate/glutamate racemase family protein [Vibrio splendidus]|uniref:Aspartate racemase n=1 Tax=Vibrio splendidus TaxID=29497 RepID=A0A2T5E1S4_VIBSP|nr:amino acid racemase [Vibrio splendidus]OEF78335.1 aspartate racemase [Vibrio splendidus 1F-157]PMP37151.1 aspartate racemase [Vibrio splendidus]PTP13286.1 aspartate racemase [Vibrio splendidus]PTP61745.1 aspartate racemase [Vibrio splendidus]